MPKWEWCAVCALASQLARNRRPTFFSAMQCAGVVRVKHRNGIVSKAKRQNTSQLMIHKTWNIRVIWSCIRFNSFSCHFTVYNLRIAIGLSFEANAATTVSILRTFAIRLAVAVSGLACIWPFYLLACGNFE